MTSAGSYRPDAATWDRRQSWSSEPTHAVRLPGLAVFGLWLLVLGSLFTSLPGPAALGEIRGEGALAGAAILLLFSALSGIMLDVRAVKALALYLPFSLCILLSFAINADHISASHFLGRAGGEKFLSALLVFIFYICTFHALLSLMIVYGVTFILRGVRSIAICAGVMLALEMGFELITWVTPPLRALWTTARSLWTHDTYAPLFRLVAFSSEPSFGSIAALGVLGLLGSQLVYGKSGLRQPEARRLPIALLMATLFGLQLVADARTFVIGGLGAALAWILLSPMRKALPPWAKSAAIVLGPLPIEALMIWIAVEATSGAHSVSNISRSIGMLTGVELWKQQPLFGVGLGQYGFHFRNFIPSWGLQSWEVSRYFQSDQYDLLGGLPPSYSLFTRLSAELGLIGFIAWAVPPLYAIRRALITCPGRITTMLVCCFASQLWTGLSLDSFRNIYYWIWLAALLAWPQQCAHLQDQHPEFATGPQRTSHHESASRISPAGVGLNPE